MPKRYSEPEIEKALVAAATFGIRPAARQVGVNESTLRGWIGREPDRFAEIREREAPQWRKRAAVFMEDAVVELGETEKKLRDRLHRSVSKLDPRDLAPAVQKVALAQAIAVDKASLLRGEPTEIVEHRDAENLIAKLRAAGVVAVEQVVDATVVEPSELESKGVA